MDNAYLALGALCLASFLVPLAQTLRHWWAGQSPLAEKFVYLNLGLFGFVLFLLANYVAVHLAPLGVVAQEVFFDSAFFLLYSMLVWFATRFFLELLQGTWQGWVRAATVAVTLLGPVLLFLVHALVFDGGERVRVLRFALNGLYLPLVLAWMAGVFVASSWQLRRAKDAWKRSTVAGATLVFVLAIPFIVVDALWPLLQLQLKVLPRAVNLHLVMFVAWNVYFASRWQRFSPPPPASATEFDPALLQQERFRQLTSREQEVVVAVMRGRSNLDIAHDMGISVGTVKNHVYHVFNKTGASSRKELVEMLLPP